MQLVNFITFDLYISFLITICFDNVLWKFNSYKKEKSREYRSMLEGKHVIYPILSSTTYVTDFFVLFLGITSYQT